MPSTYTTNGGIELPANGEQSGTWGETVNDNMSIIDRLTNGVGSISLSGTTHTLTTTDGTLSDGQYNVLVLGGSPSGTNTITISPNDGEHVYIVKNISGQTATFTQGSGASISVLNNTTKIIYADGAGAGAAVVDITGALDLGSLIIAGTSVTATAAELNFVDGVTSNVQTQLNTKAPLASPTFTGTATVTGNLSVDGGTIKLDGNYPVGSNNVALGDGALDASLTGASNTAIGSYSLTNNTSGASNTGLGFAALGDTTTGNYNTGIGTSALENNTTASENTAVGYQSLYDNTTGANNVAVGTYSLANNTTASNNTAVGTSALYVNTTGASNVGLGTNALSSNTTASYNTAVGYNALTSNTTGPALTAIGAYALANNTTGSSNTAAGWYALISNTTGNDNTAVGRGVMQSNTTGYSNVAIGGAGVFTAAALQANTEGYGNIAIGAALTGNTTGTQNVAIGRTAMYSGTTGSSNVAIGQAALTSNTTAGNNTAVGFEALYTNTTGDGNTSLGKGSLRLHQSGQYNTAVGYGSLESSTTGNNNCAVGTNSGYNITTGQYNQFIGRDCRGTAAGQDGANGFGYDIQAEAGYTTVGNSTNDIRAAHGTATWSTVSDERYKKDIVDSTVGLSFINDLTPRTFKYKTLGELPETFRAYKEGSTQVFKNSDTNHGFIAQEIKAAIDLHPEIKDGFRLWDDRDDGSQEVAEAALIPVLVKAIQELSAKNDALEARLAALES
jgi:trimeric autotransporter adhesin